MASHHTVLHLRRPRTPAHVLLDLSEAQSDWEQALADAERAATPMNAPVSQEEFDAADRMSEADRRLDELREEFAAVFAAATGLRVEEIFAAREGGLL